MPHIRLLISIACLGSGLSACVGAGPSRGIEGTVRSDGSSTLFPVAEALAEEYQRDHPEVRVTVGRSGSAGGMALLCDGVTDLANLSREPVDSEWAACRDAGIELLVVPVALDGLTVVTHPGNTFVACLTVDELAAIWEPDSAVRTWRDVRPEFPERELRLYGAGPASGTFDTFTRVVLGRRGASRTDFQASEDDNVLVRGVAGDRGALGYFGYGYASAHGSEVRILAVDGGEGCVTPTSETIVDGSYAPLARPLFMAVSVAALEKDAVRSYLSWFFERATAIVLDAGSIPLRPEQYAAAAAQVDP